MNSRRLFAVSLLAIIAFSALVIVLKGSSPQRNALQLDAMNYISSTNATSLGPTIWYDRLSGSSGWTPIPDTSATNETKSYLTSQNNSLNLTVFFAAASQEQAVSLYRRPITVSLNALPFAIATVSVSPGIHYGIRFSGVEPGNIHLEAWRESSPLQHRLGLGVNENLTANLSLESYLANGDFPLANSTITSIKFYLEATPGQTGWFSMVISYLSIFSMQHEAYLDNGKQYNGIILYLSRSFTSIEPSNESLFRAYVGLRIDGSPSLQYRLYLNQGLVQEAEGYTYHQKSTTDYEESVLLPQNINDFPQTYSDSNLTYVSVVALQGNIKHFRLDTLTFQYLSQTPTDTGFLADHNLATLLYAYYMIFLFVTPIVMTILLGRSFRDEKG